MTPLEKALNEPRGNYLTQADWMAGCITAFLEAAAEDAGALYSVTQAAQEWKSPFPFSTKAGKAAILALKETLG